MPKCGNCGTDFEGKSCPNCGLDWLETKNCPECGLKIKGNARFCSDCGYSFYQTTAPLQETRSRRPSAFGGWLKKRLEIVIPLIVVAILAIVLACVIPFCITNPINGTYYKLNDDGKPVRATYFKLKSGKWTDCDGESGTYIKKGDNIVFYYTLFGETEEFCSGTLINYVLKVGDCTYASENHRHSYGEWETTLAASCFEDGVETRICACGAKKTQTVDQIGHHNYGEWVTTKSATCTEDGIKERVCSVCNQKEFDTIDKVHTFDEWGFDDSGHWQVCSVCGEKSETSSHINENVCDTCGFYRLKYELNDDNSGYTVYGISGLSYKEVVIPETYNGLPVTSIGDEAFYYCRSLTSITLPDSVRIIGVGAFYYCSSLKSITIPDGVISIGSSAFYGCGSLTSVSIPDSVTSIGDYAFYNCSSLTSVSIPDGVTSIGDEAFYYCSSLTSITIPDSVRIIGVGAFYYCSSLTSITIPDSVTSIGSSAFYGCGSLTSVSIPDSVTSIGGFVFAYCSSLTSVNVAANNNSYCSVEGILFDKNKTTLILYPAGKTNNSFTVPDSVTSIGSYAFHNCRSLTSVSIPDSVTYIGSFAFAYCRSLTSASIPDGVAYINAGVFSDCSSLTSVSIGNSVAYIGSSAFYNCSSLESITLPDSVRTIGESVFYNCSSLKSITIPAGVAEIANYSFQGCSSLENIEYLGTKEQWQAISKGGSWCYQSGYFTVHCTDGDIDKYGKEI